MKSQVNEKYNVNMMFFFNYFFDIFFFQSVISMISVCLNEETTTTRLGGTSKDILSFSSFYYGVSSTPCSVEWNFRNSIYADAGKIGNLKRVKTFPEIFFSVKRKSFNYLDNLHI